MGCSTGPGMKGVVTSAMAPVSLSGEARPAVGKLGRYGSGFQFSWGADMLY